MAEDPDLMAVLQRLTSVAQATMTLIGAVLSEFGLTMSSAAVLWMLDPRGETPTMRVLARRMGCDPSTISLTVDKLERSGLIERRPHPTDRRKRTLALTPKGLGVWQQFAATLSRKSGVGALDRGELQTLDALLVRCAQSRL